MMDDEFRELVLGLLVLGAVRLPLLGGNSGALLCGVRGMSQLEVGMIIKTETRTVLNNTTYPLAKMGVSGREQDVCRRRSSRGL